MINRGKRRETALYSRCIFPSLWIPTALYLKYVISGIFKAPKIMLSELFTLKTSIITLQLVREVSKLYNAFLQYFVT